MKKIILFLAISAALCAQPFPTDPRGIILTGLTATQDNILGPLTQSGSSPWAYGDIIEKGVAVNMAPAAIAEAPALAGALPGTVSWSAATNTITTTSSWVGLVSGGTWLCLTWNSVDGTATGRSLTQVSSATSTTVTTQTNIFAPTSSGVTAYLMPGADSHGWDFNSWTATQPNVTWNYYDVAIGLYRLYYRTGTTTFQTYARAYADIQWQWVIDHGYNIVYPRAASLISQFFRATEGHSERFPGLYAFVSTLVPLFGNPAASPAIDNRETGYVLWDIALGAKTDPDSTRHTQYCSWLSTYTNTWNTVQSADGSWGENEYALNPSFVSAPKTFVAPFIYQAAPWRESINLKAMEAAYESLNDTSAQGCNNLTLAASTLASIKKMVAWLNNYGHDPSNRGVFYEVGSQSDDQDTVYHIAGTVAINTASTSLTGSGTNWQTLGYCDGTHFIGIETPRTVYKIASCASNTAATLSVAFGLYGESSNVSGSAASVAPAAPTSCHNSSPYCFGSAGDRNLTRTICGGIAWLYALTLDTSYRNMSDECLSATLGGPTSGLTGAANIGSFTLPCSGPACDGLVTDIAAAAPNCIDTGGAPPCIGGTYMYSNLGKNFGEAFGAPGIDNALAWRLFGLDKLPRSSKAVVSGKAVN